MIYPILQISGQSPDSLEQLGTKQKYWFRNEEGYFLFKIGRPGTGENWAEVIAADLTDLLGLPHANYDFAIWRGHRGVWSPGIIPDGARLVLGNELLAGIHSGYPINELRQAREHTLGRIHALLTSKEISLPPNWYDATGSINTAYDLFIGYLLLDTWIANQDRHHENWGLIHHNNNIYLSPTFDHAASMGQNETDVKRQKRMATKDQGFHISSYVTKARSAIYENKKSIKPLLTRELFDKAASKSQLAARYWINRLEHISDIEVSSLFNSLPKEEISPVASRFSQEMLSLNRSYLLNLSL